MKWFFPRNIFWKLKSLRKADTASLTAVLWVESMIRQMSKLCRAGVVLCHICPVKMWLKEENNWIYCIWLNGGEKKTSSQTLLHHRVHLEKAVLFASPSHVWSMLGNVNLCPALGCLRFRSMKRAFFLRNFSNPQTEVPGEWLVNPQQKQKWQQIPVITFLLNRLPLGQMWGHKAQEQPSPDVDSLSLLPATPYIWLLQAKGRPPAFHQPAHSPLPWVTANSPLPCSWMHSKGDSWPWEIPPTTTFTSRYLGAQSSGPLHATVCCWTIILYSHGSLRITAFQTAPPHYIIWPRIALAQKQ